MKKIMRRFLERISDEVEDGIRQDLPIVHVATAFGYVEVELDYARGEVADVMVFNQRKPDMEYPNIERALRELLPAPEGYTRYFPTPRWDDTWCGFNEY